jgi:hypothetical protein
VSISTVWRYLREAIDLLVADAPDLAQAARRAPNWRTRLSTAR